MKKIIYLISLLVLISCSDFLDLDNPNKKTTLSSWSTLDDLDSGIATIYNAFLEEPAGYWEIQAMQMKECRTENFTTRNDVQGRYAISTFRNTPSTTQSSNIFKSLYVGIFRANQVIHYADLMTEVDEAAKKILVAEAKFLRGLSYHILAIEFGDVPIVTNMITDQSEYFTSKSTQEEVYNQAVSDLQEAKTSLPVRYSSDKTGRATKGAAIAFLGKTYLYTEQWDNAEQEFRLLTDNEGEYGYGLLDNYAHLFDGNHENSIEGVFEIQFSLEGGPDIWTSNPAMKVRSTTMAQELAPGEVGGWFELIPTNVLLNAFLKEKTRDDDFDPRALATLAWDYPGCVYYTYDFAEQFGEDAVWPRKNQNWWNRDEGDWKSTLNEYPMRYADVLLMLAEAYTMQNKVAQAAPLVHRIRERAQLTDLSSTMATWSSDQMMQEIMHQRNIEFAREGMRFYDLRRWGTLEQVLKESQVEGYANYSSRYNYYPIPEQELNNNPNITQNDAWR